MLIAKLDGQRVQAGNAVRGHDYVCPDSSCCGKVRLRNRKGYNSHFYHMGSATCRSDGESPEHEAAKIALQAGYRERHIDAELEVYLSDTAKLIQPHGFASTMQKLKATDRRCDILLKRSLADAKFAHVAIEVQGAKLSTSEFDGRIYDWNLLEIPVVWVALLKPHWLKESSEVTAGFKIQKATLRDFEYRMRARYGHIWYIDPSSRSMFKGVVKTHLLYKNPKDYFDQNAGGMVSEEGGYYSAARWFDIDLSRPIPIEKVGIKRIVRKLKNGVESRIYDWSEMYEI